MTRPLAKRVRITTESLPDSEALARIEALEEDPDLEGLSLEELGTWLRVMLPGKAHGYDLAPLPPEPTGAAPGSPEKIRVMRLRLLRGQTLHHPDDNKLLSHPLFSSGGTPHGRDAE